uniref:C-X-C chemokine receptor type 2 n=1 Tax=Laticauda laticaudata TaxID=8630 RepID=A0A8C5SK33_LATLA
MPTPSYKRSKMGENSFSWDDIVLSGILDNYSDYLNDTIESLGTFTEPCKPQHTTVAIKYIVAFIYLLVCILSLLGNSLVILVVSYSKGNHSVTDVYLLNLAIARPPICSHFCPFGLCIELIEWIFGTFHVQNCLSPEGINFYSGVPPIGLYHVDRYLAIVYATRAATQKRHWVKFVCIGIWFFAFLFSLPVIRFRGSFSKIQIPLTQFVYENIGGNQTTKWRVVLRILPQVFGFLLPLIIMIICYGITVHRLYQTRDNAGLCDLLAALQHRPAFGYFRGFLANGPIYIKLLHKLPNLNGMTCVWF